MGAIRAVRLCMSRSVRGTPFWQPLTDTFQPFPDTQTYVLDSGLLFKSPCAGTDLRIRRRFARGRRLRGTRQRTGQCTSPQPDELSHWGRMQTLLPVCSNRFERLEKSTRWRREGWQENRALCLWQSALLAAYAICLSCLTLFRYSKSGNRNCGASTEIATKFAGNPVQANSPESGLLGKTPILGASFVPLPATSGPNDAPLRTR